jgi:hypothetical protein
MKQFKDVEFLYEYPSNHVCEHEVFMSFTNDDDAMSFRTWWDEDGSKLFAKWLKTNAEMEK